MMPICAIGGSTRTRRTAMRFRAVTCGLPSAIETMAATRFMTSCAKSLPVTQSSRLLTHISRQSALRRRMPTRRQRKLPLIPDTPEVELSGIFPARRFHEEVEVQRDPDRLDPQAG